MSGLVEAFYFFQARIQGTCGKTSHAVQSSNMWGAFSNRKNICPEKHC
jgi:hypothetical protein